MPVGKKWLILVRSAILPRILIGSVTGWNLLCAIDFIVQPSSFLDSFNLSGEVGITILQSIGLLFIMWNIPYLLVLIHPHRWRILLIAAILMQFIGVFGEFLLLGQISSALEMKNSILRFLYFDAAGALILIIALWVVYHPGRKPHVTHPD